jgi:hypothetical protein
MPEKSENVSFWSKKSKNVENVGECVFFWQKSQKMSKKSENVIFWSKKSKNAENFGKSEFLVEKVKKC